MSVFSCRVLYPSAGGVMVIIDVFFLQYGAISPVINFYIQPDGMSNTVYLCTSNLSSSYSFFPAPGY